MKAGGSIIQAELKQDRTAVMGFAVEGRGYAAPKRKALRLDGHSGTVVLDLPAIAPGDRFEPAAVKVTGATFYGKLEDYAGLAVREALVRDIWIISTDAGGPVDDIVEGVNGNIIPLSGDAQYLRQAVIAILDDAERFRRHHNPFKDKLTLFGDQALELQGIYAEIIEQAPPSAVAAVRLIPSIDGLEPGDGYRARS